MKIKLIVAALVLLGVAYFAFQKNDAPSGTESKNVTATTPKLGAASVLNIDPKIRSNVHVSTIAPKLAVSTEMQLFRDRKDWPGIYQRAKNGAQTGEAQYLQAELLEKCAKRPPSADPRKAAETPESKREQFLKGLAGSEAQKTVRIAAYDALNVDVCGELKQIEYSKDDIARLTKAAADAGDPHGRAWQLMGDIRKASEDDFALRKDPNGGSSILAQGARPMSTYLLADEQWEQVRGMLVNGDSGVLAELRPLLASTLKDGSLSIGTDGQPIENRALWLALGLVGCDLGQNCSANNRQLLSACAYQNQCGSASLQDHTFYYESSPHNAQLVESYRLAITEMIRTGNFSNFNLIRGTSNNGNTFIFGGR